MKRGALRGRLGERPGLQCDIRRRGAPRCHGPVRPLPCPGIVKSIWSGKGIVWWCYGGAPLPWCYGGAPLPWCYGGAPLPGRRVTSVRSSRHGRGVWCARLVM